MQRCSLWLAAAAACGAGCGKRESGPAPPAEGDDPTVFAADGLDPALNADPSCGVAGQTTVLITGSGWPEPSPPCTYDFYFDGEWVGAQADGLYGPPYLSFPIPEDADPGCDHTILVELTIDSTGALVGVAEVPFCVVELRQPEWRELIAYGGDDNPAASVPQAPSPGKRHFPDAAASGGAARSQVRIRARVEPACPNVPIYFASFDPDDGSANTAPIDNEAPTTHDDNRGDPGAGMLGAASVTTDAAGIAETTFTTTTQPGDNFLVAASADGSYILGVGVNGHVLRDGDGDVLPTDEGVVSPLLTIWRLVHMEADSMAGASAAANENRLTGTVQDSTCEDVPVPAGGVVGTCRYDIDAPIPEEVDSYEGGWIEAGGTRYDLPEEGTVNFTINTTGGGAVSCTAWSVIDVGCNTVRTLRPGGGTCPPAGQPSPCAADESAFVLHDDDDETHAQTSLPRLPDLTGRLQSTDSEATNALFRAFIRPTHDAGGDQNNLPFAKNVPAGGEPAQIQSGKSCVSSDAYWCGYIANVWQHAIPKDREPDSTSGTYGTSNGWTANTAVTGASTFGSHADNGCIVFTEFHRDVGVERAPPAAGAAVISQQVQFTTVHEFGHTMTACHGDNGIMCYPPFRALPAALMNFRDPSISRMRWQQRPGVLLPGANTCTHNTGCDTVVP